jgi:hypothetical protein
MHFLLNATERQLAAKERERGPDKEIIRKKEMIRKEKR